MRNLLFIGLIAFVTTAALGQKINNFTLTDVKTKKQVSLDDYKTAKGVVVIFTSNVCPYAVYYEGRITQLISEYKSKGIQFILINSHTEAKESEAEMANKISTWGLNVPYLADKDQSVLSQFGARKSPEVFLLKNNGSFSIFYNGAIDNNPQVATDVKEQYLKENINLLLQGKPAKSGGRPIGCMVKRG
ncbi:redoxin domain-containing protein [Fulvivirga sp. 29W222]|uniref:Redoxin domain-containing protein n=1 Tax=Fulvivirga marina TaxID=2494733 RepID=A0A937FY07_9BACT|nr:redoxin domain-containing protein [Fulvivirga marina]MBL6446460.1 redoxin domain-containing protein [Fulvivirga marina]